MTTDPSQLAQARMDLAEALTDASRSLDRTRRKIEAVVTALERISNNSSDPINTHIVRCKTGVVELEQLNNAIRKMAS